MPHMMMGFIPLTRPWTVEQRYVRDSDPRAVCSEYYIAEDNGQIAIGNENYFPSTEGILCRPRKIKRAPICGISNKRAGDGSLASANLEGSDQQRKTIARDSR
jgi:hypothetical protein